MKPSAFNNLHSFSFKDLLACAFSAPFLVTIILFMWKHDASDLDLLKTLIPVIIVVLGGYFGQEVASSYFTRGNTGYGTYGSYGYSNSVYSQQQTTTQLTQDTDGAPL